MIQTETMISLGFILAGLLSLAGFSIFKRGRSGKGFRRIEALLKLRRAAGQAVEAGKRIHVSLGNSSILGPHNASALVGLAALEGVARTGLVSDRPPVATSGDGTLAILSQDALLAAYRSNPAAGQFNTDQARLAGTTPFSYLSGIIPLQRSEQVSTNLLAGYFGPEMALFCEEGRREGALTVAATESLPAQAALYAASDEVLIGEEIFAAPAYLGARRGQFASLRAQDVLRWVLIVVLAGGAALKLLETLAGVTLP